VHRRLGDADLLGDILLQEPSVEPGFPEMIAHGINGRRMAKILWFLGL